MEKIDAIDKAIDAVKQIQQESMRPVAEFTAATRPLEDIEGFDSLNCVEAAAKLTEMLNVDIPDSVFIPDIGASSPTFEQIGDRLLEIVNVRSMAGV